MLIAFRKCPRLNFKNRQENDQCREDGDQRRVEEDVSLSFSCKECGDGFSSRYTLKRHVRINRSFNC
jgi:hypothetical protein